MKRILASTLAILLTLTACGTDTGGAEGPLVVYSGRGEELVGALIDDFTSETGIEVSVRYAGSSELAATLLAEGETSEADVFFSQDPASLGAVVGMLTTLPEQTLGAVEQRFQDDQGRWVGVSARVRVFVYNTSTSLPLPESTDDVVDPAWTGQLGIAPTNASFLAFVAAMILERGEDQTREWLEALAAIDPVEFDSNTPIVEAADDGEIQGGLVNHYYLLRRRAEGLGQNAENHFIPSGDVGSLIMPAGVGVLDDAANPEAAERFVEFLLSEEAQSYFATETFEYPVVDGVAAPEGAPPLSEIGTPDIDLNELAEVLDLATRLVAEAGLV